MTLRSIALSTAALLITTVLAGCAPAVPECHNAEVVASVQELFERGYQDAMDSPQTKFSDYVQIKIDTPLTKSLDKSIGTRKCSATLHMTLNRAKLAPLPAIGDMLIAGDLTGMRTAYDRKIRPLWLAMEIPLVQALEQPSQRRTIEYEVQMQDREPMIHTNVVGPLKLMKLMAVHDQELKKSAMGSAEQPDQRLVMVNSTAMCTDEALCVDTTKGEFRVNAYGLSEREKQLLSSRTAICLRGVSKEGDFQYFENVTPSCGR